MTIRSPRALAALVALLAAGLLAAAFAAAPAARAAASCDVSSLAGTLGATSVTSLKVTNVRCATGKSVVRAFHACRLRNGLSGRCVRLVKGYACGEIRANAPTRFSATVTCRKRRKTVVHRYTQALA